jgi:hypothetical protein
MKWEMAHTKGGSEHGGIAEMLSAKGHGFGSLRPCANHMCGVKGRKAGERENNSAFKK